jgi:hypothetical protein
VQVRKLTQGTLEERIDALIAEEGFRSIVEGRSPAPANRRTGDLHEADAVAA